MAIVESAESIRAGCKIAGIHPSTFYDWRKRVDHRGPDALGWVGAKSRAKTPGRVRLEAEVVALALANPPWGSKRVFFELKRRGIDSGSQSKVWRILKEHHLNQRALRYRTMTLALGLNEADKHRDEVLARAPRPVGVLHADLPGDLVQLDCFQIGKLKGLTVGRHKQPAMVWQYVAIDVASSFTWAQLHATVHNPTAVHTSALAIQVADDLALWGWPWKRATTDHGNEFVDHRFKDTLTELGVEHRFIAPGRPQSNGKVEQMHNTILEECWKPAFVTYKEPSITGLRQDLTIYLDEYNNTRPHGGKWNNGKPPRDIIEPNAGNMP